MNLRRIISILLVAGSLPAASFAGTGTTHYVSLDGAHVPPFLSWLDAATNIQDALDVAVDGDTVLVATGEYAVAEQVAVTNALCFSGVGEPGETIIRATASNRCCIVSNLDALVTGFTFADGYDDFGGAGVFLDASGILSNCIVIGCIGEVAGGGVFGDVAAVVDSCVIVSNWSRRGGGIYVALNGRLLASVIAYNTGGNGGGVRSDDAVVENCLVMNNESIQISGFPAIDATGGGIHNDGDINHCTVVSNSARLGGGVFGQGSIANSIVYYNHAWNSGDNYSTTLGMSSSCSEPLPAGLNNIAEPPGFRNIEACDYRLTRHSPCVDTAMDSGFTRDVLGAPRPRDGNGDGTIGYDMGAYEQPLPRLDALLFQIF